MPADRRLVLAPMFRPPMVPKLHDAAAAVQNLLNDMIRGAITSQPKFKG